MPHTHVTETPSFANSPVPVGFKVSCLGMKREEERDRDGRQIWRETKEEGEKERKRGGKEVQESGEEERRRWEISVSLRC